MFTPIHTLTREYIKTTAKPYIVVMLFSFLCVPRAIASARQAQIHSVTVRPTVDSGVDGVYMSLCLTRRWRHHARRTKMKSASLLYKY